MIHARIQDDVIILSGLATPDVQVDLDEATQLRNELTLATDTLRTQQADQLYAVYEKLFNYFPYAPPEEQDRIIQKFRDRAEVDPGRSEGHLRMAEFLETLRKEESPELAHHDSP